MKKITISISLTVTFLFVISGYGQKPKEINLFAGEIQSNGLPQGWVRAVENYECTVKFENGVFYFERHVKDEKCSFGYSQPAKNGDSYLIKTTFEIDGNGYQLFLDNSPLLDQTKVVQEIVKVTEDRLSVGFRTNSEGKVWGHILTLTATKLSDSNNLSPKAIEKIKQIAANSPIAKYSWNDRGKVGIGYVKGVALTYAKSFQELKAKQNTAVTVMSQPIGDKQTDALAFYGVKTNSDVERLRAIYTLALGLGMRESSGNTTVGWDKSKLKEKPPIEPTSENSEGGLFQVSWDSINRSPWLLKLYEQYQANPNQCLLSTFMEKTKDKKEIPFGSGDGLKFQKLMKECPSLATEYVMVMLRVNRRHFGPINTKEAEYKSDTEQMFKDIEKVIDTKP